MAWMPSCLRELRVQLYRREKATNACMNPYYQESLMRRRRFTMKGVVMALLFGASSLLAQQQQPAAVTQSGAANATEIMARGQLDGQTAAQGVGTGGWMAGGVVTGLFTGLIGTAVIWAVAGSSDVTMPPDRRLQIANEPATYQQSYESSYGQKLKSRRKGAALGGGLLGTAAFVLIYLSATSGDDQY